MLVETRVGRPYVEIPALCSIAADAPAHGRSGPIWRRFTMGDCADAVIAPMDAVGAKRPGFAGLSWRGMVAMRPRAQPLPLAPEAVTPP